MSRLWHDRLLISLSPDAVALARIAGGWRPKLTRKEVVRCDPAFGAELWQGATAALAAAVATLRGERLNATVVLSNHFVRYAIVPFDAGVASTDEEIALARYHFTRIHGEQARGWDVRLSRGPRGAARLASAVDAGLMAAVRACFPRQARPRLVSVQPYLMSAFNRWRGASAHDAWLLLVEPQRACVALYSGRSWTTVQTSRGKFQGPEDWAALIERQKFRADRTATPAAVLVHAPGLRKVVGAETREWRFSGLALPSLDGFLPGEDGLFEMALTCR